MTSYKKISLYIAMLTLFQVTNCAENKLDNDSEKYPQKSTDVYDYEFEIDEKPAPADEQPHGPRVISVKKFKNESFTNFFGLGLERKVITVEVVGGKIITKTETWTKVNLPVGERLALGLSGGLLVMAVLALIPHMISINPAHGFQ